METIRWLALVALASILPSAAGAATSAEVCNLSATGAWVALAYRVDEEVKWTAAGWWRAEAGKCTGPVELRADAKELYVFAQDDADTVEWQGTKPFCVEMDEAFEIDDAESHKCAATRPFRQHAETDGKLEIVLEDAQATRDAIDFTLCNMTDDWASVALGHAPAGDEGISVEGWQTIEGRECQTFVRRGKLDAVYFYAETAGRQLVWSGKTPLCATHHQGFRTDKADTVSCRGGESQPLPFLKKPLQEGRGTHELTVSSARAFKRGLNLCNSHGDDVYAAVAHLDEIWMNGIVARGFWLLHPGQCKLVDSVSAGPVYLYAETAAREKVWDGKDLKGCVRDRMFTYTGVDRHACDADGERRAGFLKWNVEDGANVYDFE